MDGKEGNYKFKTTRGQRRQFGWSRKRSVLSTDADESLAWVIFVMEIFRNKENCPADNGQLCLTSNSPNLAVDNTRGHQVKIRQYQVSQ